VSTIVQVCPSCKKFLNTHSVNDLVNCGLKILKSTNEERTISSDSCQSNEPDENDSKDVSEYVS